MGKEIMLDEFNNRHILNGMIGRGGQGEVHRTTDPELAIKLSTDILGRRTTSEEEKSKFLSRIQSVSLLAIPDDLNISRPGGLLKDYAGYVMRFLEDMVPLSSFFGVGKKNASHQEQIPHWLEAMPGEEQDKFLHYLRTGGLYRRLNVLHKTAGILSRLHGAGLVYGDISPNNIFVSVEQGYDEVWLIDADNICLESSENAHGVYTPRFGAPELVGNTSGITQATDCYAFSVMAFYMLSMVHPFIGDQVDAGGETDWADETVDSLNKEDQAFAGLLPWIHDRSDQANATENGMPRPLIVTEEMMMLFDRTFTEGRQKPSHRPVMYHWPKVLAKAMDDTFVCQECGMSTYQKTYRLDDQCPFCHTPLPKRFVMTAYDWNGQTKTDASVWDFVQSLDKDGFITIPRRLFHHYEVTENDKVYLRIEINEDQIKVEKDWEVAEAVYISVSDFDERRMKEVKGRTILSCESNKTVFWLFSENRAVRCMLIGERL